jgi:hypothetical protein
MNMVSLSSLARANVALALNFEWGAGRRAAGARVEVLEGEGGRLARLDLQGWFADASVRRLEAPLRELLRRELDGLLLDCTRLRDIEYWGLRRLARAIAPFQGLRDGVAWHGLSPALRDRVRIAGGASGPSRVPSS